MIICKYVWALDSNRNANEWKRLDICTCNVVNDEWMLKSMCVYGLLKEHKCMKGACVIYAWWMYKMIEISAWTHNNEMYEYGNSVMSMMFDHSVCNKNVYARA